MGGVLFVHSESDATLKPSEALNLHRDAVRRLVEVTCLGSSDQKFLEMAPSGVGRDNRNVRA
jgi:hypothetical protein